MERHRHGSLMVSFTPSSYRTANSGAGWLRYGSASLIRYAYANAYDNNSLTFLSFMYFRGPMASLSGGARWLFRSAFARANEKRKARGLRSKTAADSSVKRKMIYMHARLTRRKESSTLVIQAELRLSG